MLGSFSCTSGHLHVSFGKMSVQIFCPFKNWFVFLLLSYMSSLYILDIFTLSHMICKYFLLFIRLPFGFIDGFLCCEEAFHFMYSHLYIFAFIAFVFGVRFLLPSLLPPKTLPRQISEAYYLYFLIGVLWFQGLCSRSELIFLYGVDFHSYLVDLNLNCEIIRGLTRQRNSFRILICGDHIISYLNWVTCECERGY